MAKISAHGCHEVRRFRVAGGDQYLVRSDGVVLRKSSVPGSRWTADDPVTSIINGTIKRLYRTPEDRVAVALRWLNGRTGPHGDLEEVR
jgi:hypothetical protein